MVPVGHCVFLFMIYVLYLLHVTQNILPAVKNSPAFLRIELIDEVCGVVFITVLIPA